LALNFYAAPDGAGKYFGMRLLQRFRPGRGWVPRAGCAGTPPRAGWSFLDKIFGGRNGKSAVRRGIIVVLHFVEIKSSVRSGIGGDGINAKAQRRKKIVGMLKRMLGDFAAWRLGVKFLCRS
jgi:hypothetical protein